MNKFLTERGAPPMSELIKEASLLYLNSDMSTEEPRPLLPNTISVGAMHCVPAKPLPKVYLGYTLQNFLI